MLVLEWVWMVGIEGRRKKAQFSTCFFSFFLAVLILIFLSAARWLLPGTTAARGCACRSTSSCARPRALQLWHAAVSDSCGQTRAENVP